MYMDARSSIKSAVLELNLDEVHHTTSLRMAYLLSALKSLLGHCLKRHVLTNTEVEGILNF